MFQDDFPIRYTLCFLTRGDQVLMLLRNRPPNQGLWNGVGGHIEPGETPLAACLREVVEETGFELADARYAGILTWTGFEIANGGLYIFLAEAPQGEARENGEGHLGWHPRAWACNAPEVVGNIHRFLPVVLAGAPPQRYHFTYHRGELIDWQTLPLPLDVWKPG